MRYTVPALLLVLLASLAWGQGIGATIAYRLDKPAYVTLVVETPGGARVRNLLANAWREAGPQQELWDGLDDAGRPVPPGTYRWRGLRHDAITATFRTAIYAPGDPPWLTVNPVQWNLRAGTAGGWLSDHRPPSCLFADGQYVYVGAELAEAGHALIEVTPDGRKQWGALWFSGSGTSAVTTDNGVLYVAGEQGWIGDHLAIHRLDQRTHQFLPNPPSLKGKRTNAAFVWEDGGTFTGIRGLVVTPEALVLALADRGRLALFDKATAVFLREVPVPAIGGITRTVQGDLLAVSGQQVVRVDLATGQCTPIIRQGLQQPRGLATDAAGRLYVTDTAPAEQCVKVFDRTGAFLRRIGTPGGRREGTFDPSVMANPLAVAVDARGQVWVAEHDFWPKRVSVWTADGALVTDFHGPAYYGGGGSLDPLDAGRAYYDGMAFRLGDRTRRSTLEAVLYRPEAHQDLPLTANTGVLLHKALARGKKTYLVSDYGPQCMAILIGEVVKDHLVPRVIFGEVKTLKAAWATRHPAFVAQLGVGPTSDTGVFLWQDANGDGQAQTDEVRLKRQLTMHAGWGVLVGQDLSLHALGTQRVVRISPLAGEPLAYDLDEQQSTPLPAVLQGQHIVALASDRQGNYLVNAGGKQGDLANVLCSLSPQGAMRWTYPNPFPSNFHSSPRPGMGEIQHTLNSEGVARVNPQVGDVFQLNGNKGVRYLFTTDGLFVTALYGDQRLVPPQQSLARCYDDTGRGVRLDGVSLGDECFYGWFGNTPDGRIAQVVGKDAGNVVEVDGLASITRLAGGPLELRQAATTTTATSTPAEPVRAMLLGGMGVWHAIKRYPIPPSKPVATFAVGYSPQQLLLHVDVTDDSPFVNSGQDLTTLFKFGDAVDLRLATNPALPANRTAPGVGDVRVLFALYQGKPVAVRYRFVVPGTTAPLQFASPTGMATVDEITLLSRATVKMERTAQGYTLQASIPWAELGLTAPPVGGCLGDVGVILSDAAGTKPIARYYYYDQESQVVVDLPAEVRVTPARWGTITF